MCSSDLDWYQDKQPAKEEAFKKLLGRIHPGAIVLLHSTSSTNAEILDELLTKWEEMGYRFGTLDGIFFSPVIWFVHPLSIIQLEPPDA